MSGSPLCGCQEFAGAAQPEVSSRCGTLSVSRMMASLPCGLAERLRIEQQQADLAAPRPTRPRN